MPSTTPRWTATRLAGVALIAMFLAACGATAPSPPPSPTPEPSPGPTDGAGPSPAPATGFVLRVTTVQALPPKDTFTWTPTVLITDDLVAVQPGAITLIFPGPLMGPLVGQQLTEDAWAEIAAEAEAAGLLSGETDFTGGALAPGSAAARLQLVIDGTTYDLTGDPNRVSFCGDQLCSAEPGTPEAFATFVSLLGNLQGWVGGVGPQAPWVAESYALLVGPPPEDQGLAGHELAWPFDVLPVDFGTEVPGQPDPRCGLVTGAEAAAFTLAVNQATQITRWQASDASEVGLTVRPMLPGDDEDPCAALTGT